MLKEDGPCYHSHKQNNEKNIYNKLLNTNQDYKNYKICYQKK